MVEYRNAIRIKMSPGVEADTELVCGRLHFEAAPQSLIVAVLPEVVVLRATDRHHAMLEGIRDELDIDAAGAAAIATDLASALFMMMLRAHLEAAGTSSGGISPRQVTFGESRNVRSRSRAAGSRAVSGPTARMLTPRSRTASSTSTSRRSFSWPTRAAMSPDSMAAA